MTAEIFLCSSTIVFPDTKTSPPLSSLPQFIWRLAKWDGYLGRIFGWYMCCTGWNTALCHWGCISYKKENTCILANRQHVVITEVQGFLCVPQEMGSDFSLTAGDGIHNSSVRWSSVLVYSCIFLEQGCFGHSVPWQQSAQQRDVQLQLLRRWKRALPLLSALQALIPFCNPGTPGLKYPPGAVQ